MTVEQCMWLGMVTVVCRFSDLFHFRLNYMLHAFKQI